MGKYKTLAQNTGFVFIGTIGSKLINLVMLPLYTHWLPPSELGAVDTMNTYAMFIIGFVCLCIPDSIFIFPRNVDEEKKCEYFTSGIVFSCLMLALSSIVFCSISKIMLYYHIKNVFSIYVWLVYGLMVSLYFQNYFQSFTRSLDKMFHYSMAGIILTLAIALFSILLIPIYGMYGYVYALISAHVIASMYSLLSTKSYRYLKICNSSRSSVKEMLSYSAPLLPNSIMWWLVDGINRPVMESYLGLSVIGIYTVSQKISGLLNSMLSILTLSWGNSALDEYGKSGFNAFYNTYLKMLATVLVMGAILICAFSRFLVSLLAASEYYEAYKYVPVLMIGVVFSGLSGTVGGIFLAIKKSKFFFYSSVYAGISSVLSLMVLTPLYGLMGTVCSVAISFFVMLVARVIYSWKYSRISNIPTYVFLFLLYIVTVIVELNVDDTYRFIIYFIFVAIIVFMFRHELNQIYDRVSLKITRKN